VDAVGIDGFELPKPAWIRRELLSPSGEALKYRSTASGVTTAAVVDLAGVEGVALGLALVDLGFRPVPLYNALPSPQSVVPMENVVRAIIVGAESLALRPPAPHAPPAFLLDARRAGPGQAARPGQFDNRSLAFETDFPSASTLRQAGIVDVVLVQSGSDAPASDLAVTLAKWRTAGIAIRLLRADRPAVAVSIAVRSPGFFDRLNHWLRRTSLRGDAHRGFGGVVPHGG
jgi:hypothetical protein